jgi:hypothetical protein
MITAMHGLISRNILDIIQTDVDVDMRACVLSKATQDLFTNNKNRWSIVLLNAFHSLIQGDLTIAAYYKEQKCLTDTLQDVDECVLILNTLCGLSSHMSHAASNITMLATLASFTKVRLMLISEEMRLDNTAKTSAVMLLYSSMAP